MPVLVLRNQDLTDDQHIAFTRPFGDLQQSTEYVTEKGEFRLPAGAEVNLVLSCVRSYVSGTGTDRPRTLKEARDGFERAYILAELRGHDWNMTRTAERLGIERSHLYRKIKSYGITPPK